MDLKGIAVEETANEPLVSVITPVYNGEHMLGECIESVLAQSHRRLEHIIVNNCSTDRTLEIAREYAARDPRVRVHDNTEFLSVVDNYNRAFSLLSDESAYCKAVGADDWLFPNCLRELVATAEAHPTIGMVSAYVLVGRKIGWDGLPYPSTCVSGREVCRLRLLEGVKVFGGPAASMIRADIVRERQPFYVPGNYHGDTERYLDLLRDHDFGFVHQVLSYIRRGEDSRTTSFLGRVNSYVLADVEELLKFGPVYLTPDELDRRLARALEAYYDFLAREVMPPRNAELLRYHRERMAAIGLELDRFRLGRRVAARLLDLLCNPKRTLESTVRRLRPRVAGSAS